MVWYKFPEKISDRNNRQYTGMNGAYMENQIHDRQKTGDIGLSDGPASKKSGRNINETMRAFTMVTQLGISMLAPVVLCAFVGSWLDERFGWSVTAVLLVLGVMAGARNTWILIKEVSEPGSKGRRENDKKIQNK